MNNGTVPTPIIDVTGKATTVHRKIADATANTSRVAALGGNSEPTEKRTAIKPPKYSRQFNNLKDTDVVEVGQKKEDGEQNIYLNGKVIGYVSSDDETQMRRIANSNLASYGGERKVWRAYVRGPKIADGVVAARINGDSFSRTNTVFGVADDYVGAEKRAEQYRAYIASGGIYFAKEDRLDAPMTVQGVAIKDPEGTTVKYQRDNGHLTTGASITDDVRGGLRSGIDFNKGTAWLSQGYDLPTVHFDIDEGGALHGDGDSEELSPQAQDFIDRVESYTKQVVSAHNGW